MANNETENKLAAVEAAEAKVEEVKAAKAAKEAAKDAAILEKHPKIGKGINIVRHNKWKILGGVVTGGASLAIGYVAGDKDLFGIRKRKAAKAAEATEVSDNESEELPFEG
jgi:hypothetical protein